MRELQCIDNLETYAGDSKVADGTTDTRQIRASSQAKRGTLVLQVGSWGVGLTPTFPPQKKSVTETKAKNHSWTENLETVVGLKWRMRNGCWVAKVRLINPLNPELNPICYLLALLVHHFLHVSGIRVKSLTLRLLMSYIYIYIYGAPILDVSRSYTTTHHSR